MGREGEATRDLRRDRDAGAGCVMAGHSADAPRKELTKRTDLAPEGPEMLYWYRSLAGERKAWARETIVDSTLYLSAPADYNDPFEFRFRFSFNASRAKKVARFKADAMEVEGLPEDEAERRAQEMADPGQLSDREFEAHMETSLGITLVENWRNKTGVISLTTADRHPLMWAHYAQEHRGICLEFNTAAIGQERNPLVEALPVRYQAHLPFLAYFDVSAEELVTATALTKSDHWKYEDEWRVVRHGAGGKKIPYPPEALTGIALGARISPSDEADVCEWAATLNDIELRRMRLATGTYGLEVEV